MSPRSLVPLLAAGALALVLAGCGASGASSSSDAPGGESSTSAPSSSAFSSSAPVSTSASSSSASPSNTTTSSTIRARRSRRLRPHGARVGRAQQVQARGSTLMVTVTRVYPRLSNTGAPPVPGTHAAGVALTIFNARGATYDSTASGDVSVLTSAGLATPLFIKHGVCATPPADFESLIGVGETRAGCVGFAIPRGARIIGVRFSPQAQPRGTVTWR